MNDIAARGLGKLRRRLSSYWLKDWGSYFIASVRTHDARLAHRCTGQLLTRSIFAYYCSYMWFYVRSWALDRVCLACAMHRQKHAQQHLEHDRPLSSPPLANPERVIFDRRSLVSKVSDDVISIYRPIILRL